MGPERLIRLAARATALVVAGVVLLGCAASPPPPSRAASGARARPRHLQIVRAMTTPQRRVIVDRFRERNPTRGGAEWRVHEEALGKSLAVVEPFAGFLRRARLERAPAPSSGAAIGADAAVEAARAFVTKNADLFGFPRAVALGLAERVRQVEPKDHASPRAAWAVRLDAPFASKGYEAFRELDNTADVEVFVDDDGEPSGVVNLSKVHPHLAIDTRPMLGQEDPRVTAKLVGRTVFALVDDGQSDLNLRRHLRALHRIPLGKVRPEDVKHIELIVHVSAAPELAWLTYRLAYFIEVAKLAPPSGQPDREEPSAGEALASPPQYYFFRYVVDADTGDVVEDARVPVAPPRDSSSTP